MVYISEILQCIFRPRVLCSSEFTHKKTNDYKPWDFFQLCLAWLKLLTKPENEALKTIFMKSRGYRSASLSLKMLTDKRYTVENVKTIQRNKVKERKWWLKSKIMVTQILFRYRLHHNTRFYCGRRKWISSSHDNQILSVSNGK